MKLSNIINLVSVSCVSTVFAQDYTVTSDPLVVSNGNHEEERYVERSVVSGGISVRISNLSSYTGHNIILNESLVGISGEKAAAVKLDADEGTWNTIAAYRYGIYLYGTVKESLISNTRVEMRDGLNSSDVWGISATNSQSGVRLSNVVVDMTQVRAIEENWPIYAILASDDATIYNNANDGGVSIKFEESRGIQVALSASSSANINLHHADISLKQGISIMAKAGSAVYLTDSKIAAKSDNILILAGGSYSDNAVVTLNRVDLSKALDQQMIGSLGTVTINLINGTRFDGYAASDFYDPTANTWSGKGSIILNIDSGASWNVTRDSDLGLSGSLSLSGDSTIYFHSDGAGDFMNINSASVMLAEGSLLQLDMDSSSFSSGDIITLFTGVEANGFMNDGAILASADGYSLSYIDYGNGQFELTGEMIKLIPEPATATLSLLGLLSLASRRRRG